MDCSNHLHNSLALVDYLLLAILTDNCQLALNENAVVHSRMVMPTQLLSCREYIFNGHKFGTTLEIIGELNPVPALRCTDKFGLLHLLRGGFLLWGGFLLRGGSFFLRGRVLASSKHGQNGHH